MKARRFTYKQIYDKLLKMLNESFHDSERFWKINNLFKVLENEKHARCLTGTEKLERLITNQ